jgi:hypothetical protein
VHHPPTSAFEFHNPQHGVTVSGNMNFGVMFHTNSVTVGTKGGLKVRLTLPDGTEELYLLEEGVPDMLIKNVIFGTKYVYWTGSLHVNCPSTGFHAQLGFGYEDSENVLNGVIWNEHDVAAAAKPKEKVSWGKWARGALKTTAKYTHLISADHDENTWMQSITPLFDLNNIIAKVHGICGHAAYVYPLASLQDPSVPRDKRERYLLTDPKQVRFQESYQYPTADRLAPNASLRVWHDVGAAIVADDMESADEAKSAVEVAQREVRATKAAEGLAHEAVYFAVDSTDGWEFWSCIKPKWFIDDDSCIYVSN